MMDAGLFSAGAALVGAAIGGSMSFLGSWIGQQREVHAQWVGQDRLRRQELYKEFIQQASHGVVQVKCVIIRVATLSFRCLLRYPRPEPYCVTRLASEHDQPHIRSPPVAAAAPTSRLRRAGLRKTRPFLKTAFQAKRRSGSSTWIRQDRSDPGRLDNSVRRHILRRSSSRRLR